jgi:hypothetical protein
VRIQSVDLGAEVVRIQSASHGHVRTAPKSHDFGYGAEMPRSLTTSATGRKGLEVSRLRRHGGRAPKSHDLGYVAEMLRSLTTSATWRNADWLLPIWQAFYNSGVLRAVIWSLSCEKAIDIVK